MAQTHSLDLESGSSQYGTVADTGVLDITGDLTIEAWIKPETLTTMAVLAKWNTGSSQRSYWFGVNSSTSLVMGISNNGTSFTDTASDSYTFATGVWYHVAATYTASTGTVRYYVNGYNFSTKTGFPTSVYSGTADLACGAMNAGGYTLFFDGLVKDVRLFNDVRSAAEIASDAHTEDVSDANLIAEYNFNNAATDSSGNSLNLTLSGSPSYSTDIPWTAPSGIDGSYLETNLQGYWTFDESSGNASDSTANNNDLTNNNSATYSTGKINNAADLERSSSQYFNIADASQTGLDFSDELTFAGWIKLESLVNNDQNWFITKRLGTGNQRSYDFYYVYETANRKLWFDSYTNGSTTGMNNGVIWDAPSTGTWYHIAVTKKGTVATFYVNGVSIGSYTGSNATIYNSTAAFEVGAFIQDSQYVDGMMDEWGAWSTALSYGGILDLYNAGTGISFAAGTAYNETYTETMTLVDTVNKSTTKVLTDVMTLVDTVVKATTRTLSDAIAMVDTFTGAKIIDTILTETLALTDSITRAITAVRTETMTLVDTATKATTKVLSDAMTLVDTVTFQSARGIELLETLSLTDTIRKVLNGSSTIWTKTARAAAATWTKITKAGQ